MDGALISCLAGTGYFAWHQILNIVTVIKALLAGNWELAKGPTEAMRKKDIEVFLISLATCMPFVIDQIPQSFWDFIKSKFGLTKQTIINAANQGENQSSTTGNQSSTETSITQTPQTQQIAKAGIILLILNSL